MLERRIRRNRYNARHVHVDGLILLNRSGVPGETPAINLKMRRFCQRCRRHREVDWAAPGTAMFCPGCLATRASGQATAAQSSAQARRSKRRREGREAASACLDRLKAQHGCGGCGEVDPGCLDCYAEDSRAVTVPSLLRRGIVLKDLAKIFESLRVLCANCVRKAGPREEARVAPAASGEVPGRDRSSSRR